MTGSRFTPWLAAGLLYLVLELPTFALPPPFRPSAETLLVLALFVLSLWLGRVVRRALGVALVVFALLCMLTQLDRAVFLQFMGEEPLLYDQLFMLRHLFVLIADVLTPKVLVGALIASVSCFVLAWIARALLRAMRRGFGPPARVPALAFGLGLCALALVFTSVKLGGEAPLCWLSPGLYANAIESRAIYRDVQQQLRASPYRSYAGLALKRRPNVYFVFVESYGRLLTASPWLRKGWLRELGRFQQRISNAGWFAASGFSRAPVMGGRSWLAEGTVLMGIRIPYEAVFHHLVSQIERVPNLVGFLEGHGYHTVLLAPSDRERPGVENANYYRYQRIVRFPDLGYHGTRIGWGMVPDQFSLNYTSEHVLHATPRPFYFEFHMVTSHAPWEELPELVPDYRALNQGNGSSEDEDPGGNAVLSRLRRYRHSRRFTYAGSFRRSVGHHYAAAIRYEFEVLTRYFEHLDEDALVVIIGDHQPPLLAAETRNFDTPVHVLARDPALLLELKEHGFRDGLVLSPDEGTTVMHEGLFSLLVRDLVRGGGDTAHEPDYLARGVHVAR